MILGTALKLTLAYEGTIQVKEHVERHRYYHWAKGYCNEVGKPLLRIGMRRSILEPPNGDYVLDLDPAVLTVKDAVGVLGDETNIPFEDKAFGVAFNEHTLEHLADAAEVERAVNECRRVADYTVLLAPSPYSIWATFFSAGHRQRLWLKEDTGEILVRPNNYKLPFNFHDYSHEDGHVYAHVGQSMVVGPLDVPIVIEG